MENATSIDGYTISIQKNRGSDERISIILKEIDEPTYVMVRGMLNKDKEMEAAKFLLKTLRIGGVSADEITNDFRRLQACIFPLLEFLTPLDGELKKN
jgi:hypothetical protein